MDWKAVGIAVALLAWGGAVHANEAPAGSFAERLEKADRLSE
jgi:hypothetical protein